MKKLLLLSLILIPFISFSQEKNLTRQFGVGATLLGVGAFYEQPITKSILAEVSVGYGSTFIKGYPATGFIFSVYKPYSRINIRAYYNRNKRIRKGKNISHNWGNFIGIQNKMMYGFGNNEDYSSLTYMINEIHWGVQTQLNNKLLLTFHLGLGYYLINERYRDGFLPTAGIRLKYVLH